MKLLLIALVAATPIAANAQNRAVLSYAAVSTGSAPTEPTRIVEYAVHENGRLIAAPVLDLEEGLATAVSAGGYALRIRVDRAESGTLAYVVRSSLYRPAEPEWTLMARPEMTVTPGEPTTLNVATPQGSRLSIRVTVR